MILNFLTIFYHFIDRTTNLSNKKTINRWLNDANNLLACSPMIHGHWTCITKLTHGCNLLNNIANGSKAIPFTFCTAMVVLWSQPLTHVKSKGQCNQLMHNDLNDISVMTAHSYPILTLLRLCTASDLASKTASASDCTRGRTRTETASESYHTKGGETRCRCPREMWAP